jgi:hypothetical protein
MTGDERCFSRSGWWQTLCGLDAANQGHGWHDKKKYVGCKNCLALIALGEHRRWKGRHILVQSRSAAYRRLLTAIYKKEKKKR